MSLNRRRRSKAWPSSTPRIAEYHKHYGSAALMLVNGQHETIAKKEM